MMANMDKEKNREYQRKYYQKRRLCPKFIKYQNEYMRKYRLNNDYWKRYSHAYGLKLRYGLTVEQYNEMLEKQNGRCGICSIHKNDLTNQLGGHLYVDHDHLTGKVRGLLCRNCNLAIGYFEDKSECLKKAILYLINHSNMG